MRAEVEASVKQREGRLVHTVFGWYAKTREQMDLGPFASKQEALTALGRHIQLYRGLNQRFGRAPQHIHIHDPDHCQRSNCADCVEAREMQFSMAVG